MNFSPSIAKLADSLAKAQGEIENATKGAVNDHFKNRYADLAEVLNTIRPVFSKYGLAVTQFPAFDKGLAVVTTLLVHSSGEWLRSTLRSPVARQDAQGIGAAITYLRRYSLAAVAGIAQEDDDGNAASGLPSAPAKAAAAKPASKPAGKAAAAAKAPAEPPKPDPETARKHLAAIESAKTEPELRAAFSNAVSYARATDDKDAEEVFVSAKDIRKAELAQ